MISSPPEMRALTHNLTTSVWTLAAIGVLFESELVLHLASDKAISLDELASRCPTLSKTRIERCLAIAAASGVVITTRPDDIAGYRLAIGALPFTREPMRSAMRGDIRSALMQSLAFLDDGAASSSWKNHTDPVLVQAQGDMSAGFPPMFKMNMLASFEGLAERLEQSGARFLDIGAGVGALAIAMCQVFPKLHVVGVDSAEVPLAMARDNVKRANLTDRIELRCESIDALHDESAFDLAWLPSFFIESASFQEMLVRVKTSLRPGGWLLFPTLSSPAASEKETAVFTLLNDLWGGLSLTPLATSEALLKEAGFTSVRSIVGPSWAPAMIVGQRT